MQGHMQEYMQGDNMTADTKASMKKEKGIWLFAHGSIAQGSIAKGAEQRFIGQKDTELSSGGREDFEALSQRFVEELGDTRPKAFFCSDMSCAVSCADILRRAFRPAGGTMPVIADHGFRDQNFGAWEGLTREEVEKRYPGALEERARDICGYAPMGGESLDMLKSRALMALVRARLHTPEGIIVIVGHPRFNRCILADYLALPLKEAFSIPQPYLAQSFLENR